MALGEALPAPGPPGWRRARSGGKAVGQLRHFSVLSMEIFEASIQTAIITIINHYEALMNHGL